jgi:formylglycine-generating enzyme required for sulfatase activity
MRVTSAAICLCIAGVVSAPVAQAGNNPGRALAVLDGDTVKVVAVDGNGKEGGGGTFGIRGIVAPALDQPFGLQARDKLKELVEGKGVFWNGPVPRAHKEGIAVFMRDAENASLAKQLLSAGLAWVVEDELMGKPAQPGGEKKPWPEAAEWISAAREAREAGRGLWADKDPVPPWEWRARMKEITNGTGMRLVFVPRGTFVMGSPADEPGREPAEVQHQVEISRGFYLGATEVTVGQFRKFVAETGYKTSGEAEGTGGWGVNPDSGKMESGPQYTWKNTGFPQTDEHPVVIVSWTDADAFCRWLVKKENRDFRLPTEAEWEYACRAGTKTAYSCGATVADLARVGFKENAAGRFTVPVGGFEKNAFGIFDMHGNAWEWCQDFYDPKGYAGGRQTDPQGPATGMARVQRGGGWSSTADRWRSAARIGRDPVSYRGSYQGFRVALTGPDAVAWKTAP